MRMVRLLGAAVGVSLIATPVMAASLSGKERARVARAAPRERDDVRYCLLQRKKGGKKGALIGAAGGAGVGVVAGGSLGETLLGAGAGAVAGHLIGKGSAGGSVCDRVLRRNP